MGISELFFKLGPQLRTASSDIILLSYIESYFVLYTVDTTAFFICVGQVKILLI